MTISISDNDRQESSFFGKLDGLHSPTFSATSLKPMHGNNDSLRRVDNTIPRVNLYPRVMVLII